MTEKHFHAIEARSPELGISFIKLQGGLLAVEFHSMSYLLEYAKEFQPISDVFVVDAQHLEVHHRLKGEGVDS